MAKLEFQQVSKRFGPHTAVADFSLSIVEGEFLGLIGPNGAGKTTTLRMAVGHLRPSRGRVLLDGQDVLEHPLEARRRIGYVPEYISLYDYLTGAEYVLFAGELKGVPEPDRSKAVGSLLDLMELGEERGRLIRTYSQGMRRKVALAGAMIGAPPILILDEALNGLDPSTSHRLKSHFAEMVADGATIVISSHVLEVLERICNRVAIMDQGRLVDTRDFEALEVIRRSEGGLERHFMDLVTAASRSASSGDGAPGHNGRET